MRGRVMSAAARQEGVPTPGIRTKGGHFRLSLGARRRLTFDEVRILEALVDWGYAGKRCALTRASFARAFGWQERHVGKVLVALEAQEVIGLLTRTTHRRTFTVPDVRELEARILELDPRPKIDRPSPAYVDRCCSRVARILGARAACVLRHVATSLRGHHGGVRGLVEAVARMGHPGSERTVRRAVDDLVNLGLVRRVGGRARRSPVLVATLHDRELPNGLRTDRRRGSYDRSPSRLMAAVATTEETLSRYPKQGSTSQTALAGETSLEDLSLLSPPSKSSSLDQPEPEEITPACEARARSNPQATDPDPIATIEPPTPATPTENHPMTKPTEQKPLFADLEPEDRVWSAFVAERAEWARRNTHGRELARMLRMEPRFTPGRRRHLLRLIAANGEDPTTYAAVGLWHRNTPNPEAIASTTIDMLWKWGEDEGWLERLEMAGYAAIDERRHREEQERARAARRAAGGPLLEMLPPVTTPAREGPVPTIGELRERRKAAMREYEAQQAAAKRDLDADNPVDDGSLVAR